MKIIHLSHTNILMDSRILKEIISLTENPENNVLGVGINKDIGARKTQIATSAEIISLSLFFRKFKLIPSFIRHFLVAIEMTIIFIYIGLKYKPNIVHCHDSPALFAGITIKWLLKSKVIYDAHELESQKNGQSTLSKKMTLLFEKKVWGFIDLLITVSPSIDNWYQKNIGIKESIVVLNSPLINSECISPKEGIILQKNYFHKKFNIPVNSAIFIYLGGLVQGRGIELLLKIFSSENVKSHLVIVGYGPLKKSIQKAESYSNRIHLHSSVPHEQVVHLAENADFGLCLIENISLSDYYSLPNKLFEYAFSGLPVLSSNFPDITKIIDTHNLGNTCELNIESITNGIIKLENSKNNYHPLNLENLSWDAQARKLVNAYIRI
jgi:glycosyltransferase involved in cell wall biosynthesis